MLISLGICIEGLDLKLRYTHAFIEVFILLHPAHSPIPALQGISILAELYISEQAYLKILSSHLLVTTRLGLHSQATIGILQRDCTASAVRPRLAHPRSWSQQSNAESSPLLQ